MHIDNLRIAGWLLLISLLISIFHGFYPVGLIETFWNFVCLRSGSLVSPFDQNSKITGCCVVFGLDFS